MFAPKKNINNTNSEADKQEEPTPDQLDINISCRIGQRVINADVNKSLYIPSPDKLNASLIKEELATNPSLHARWNALYNEAMYEYDVFKTKVDVWLAKKSQSVRKELLTVEKGRVTDKQIEDLVKTDPEYTSMHEDLAKHKKNMRHILTLATGFSEKGEKLIYIASMLKSEMGNIKGGESAQRMRVPIRGRSDDADDPQWVKQQK